MSNEKIDSEIQLAATATEIAHSKGIHNYLPLTISYNACLAAQQLFERSDELVKTNSRIKRLIIATFFHGYKQAMIEVELMKREQEK